MPAKTYGRGKGRPPVYDKRMDFVLRTPIPEHHDTLLKMASMVTGKERAVIVRRLLDRYLSTVVDEMLQERDG